MLCSNNKLIAKFLSAGWRSPRALLAGVLIISSLSCPSSTPVHCPPANPLLPIPISGKETTTHQMPEPKAVPWVSSLFTLNPLASPASSTFKAWNLSTSYHILSTATTPVSHILLNWITGVACGFHTYQHPHNSHSLLSPHLHTVFSKLTPVQYPPWPPTSQHSKMPLHVLPTGTLLPLWAHLLLCHSITPLQAQWPRVHQVHQHLGACTCRSICLESCSPHMWVWLIHSFYIGFNSSITFSETWLSPIILFKTEPTPKPLYPASLTPISTYQLSSTLLYVFLFLFSAHLPH